jgi:peptidoglycan/xylan/chitin deacetylase (PgdA/CDA1 family)
MRARWRRLVFRTTTIVCTTLVVLVLVVAIQPPAAFAVLERVFPKIVWRARVADPVVGLSFDDGPDPEFTPRVLEILRRYDAKATFFLIGGNALRQPDVLQRIRAEGHEVGNHYISNAQALRDSREDFLVKLRRTETILGLSGRDKLYRPPGGLVSREQLELLAENGYRCILGSAYPYDPTHPPLAYVHWVTTKNLRPGAIVILHDGIPDASVTLAALPGILESGRRSGYRFVGVGALLELERRETGGGVP